MRVLRFGVTVCCLLVSAYGWAEVDVIKNTESPTGKFAVGFDEVDHVERLWLVSLPEKQGVGNPSPSDNFVGLPYHGGAVWNTRRRLIALTQGGIPYCHTKVFRYSKLGLKELQIPDLDSLPEKRYHFVPVTVMGNNDKIHVERTYISAERWIGRDKLLMSVSGTAAKGIVGQKQFLGYRLSVTLRFDNRDRARIIRIFTTPLTDN